MRFGLTPQVLEVAVARLVRHVAVDSQQPCRLWAEGAHAVADAAGLIAEVGERMLDQLVAQAQYATGLRDGAQAVHAVHAQASDVGDVGLGEEPLRAAAGVVPEAQSPVLELRPDLLGVEQPRCAISPCCRYLAR